MIHCDIVSAETAIYSGPIEFMAVIGTDGELGVCYGHAPLLTELKAGPVRIQAQDGTEETFYLEGGFIEVQPHRVTILADCVLNLERVKHGNDDSL